MELKHEAGHYIKLKYDWISVDAATNEISFPQCDAGFLKDWTLVQIEGEEAVQEDSVEQQQVPTGKAGAAGAKAQAGKAKVPDKKGAVKAMEEITDNRPRTVKYERNCAEENGDVGLEVTEAVAI